MKQLSAAALFISGALLLLLPRILAPVCIHASNIDPKLGAFMPCSDAAAMTYVIGAITMACSCAVMFAPDTATAKGALWLCLTLAGLLFYGYLLTPGVCHAEGMPCRASTLPAALALGAFQVFFSLLGLFSIGSLDRFRASLRRRT
ncbi:DUF4418 family protein [Geobacter sulfurreducens]|jgi:hypothetical protein|uniref:Uncharacterized protein n=1 Tax=Geobacter sulfurreducens (strain ATCC 51573 / DSM 12127 / PCA) TaxID=243231 RepID=Q748Q8_GEOSL|nr:DUF4418 family protein [Geobacter sulfurreducens]AAR36335.1 hypothetical protein GSU2943 [Geobacter sulfurreducens PCA]ADI85699.1 hypothetical protein KN400_2887 [Geobacter sulfurreducens KN400]AJY69198.1 hypothetical protein RW64_06065 [Geobacter sulfurreducens]QVW34755.1 DUF4418 family protein [Geobacter sulfurreducens]UAC03622.1 DUF4418 family protein [Geobacter sulfurreducens]